MKQANQAQRKTGRPLSFDRDTALREAMLVFWRHGYETSSIVDLTTAMKITPPSLYAAFGDKRKLFLEAVALYAGDPVERARTIEAAPSAYAAASGLLDAVAASFTGEETPAGCLLASATATGSPAAADVQRAVAEIRRGLSADLFARIEKDVADGVLPGGTDAAVLADLVVAVIQGLSVLARDGATRLQLLAIARAAMRAWPDHPTDAPRLDRETAAEIEPHPTPNR
jgi:AcrR family transcriptional regulator